MAGGRPGTARRPTPRPSRFFRRPLYVADPASFPYRQTIRLALAPGASVEARVRSVFAADGFENLALVAPDGGFPPTLGAPVAGERNFRRGPASRRKRVAIVGIFGCGLALGVLDALLFSDPLYGLPWAGLAAVFAVLLWWAFGRAYESDVVVVMAGSLKPPPAAAPPGTGAVTVWGGHVRSEVFSGTARRARDAVEILPELSALLSVKDVVRALQGGPAPAPDPGPAVAPAPHRPDAPAIASADAKS
ncbi:MAG TPA: hypothetical protein VEL82_05005 [Thermoplasmata archaeon]|nr:hypothetical protein [Thermoplasmata archaeon]